MAVLDMFVSDAELAQLEATLPALYDPARLQHVIALAWHLRQRDVLLARSLAREATDLLSSWPDRTRGLAEARLMLVEGEAQWLIGELDEARSLAEQAMIEFDQQGDAVGSADARWLRAWVDVDRGGATAGQDDLDHAVRYARDAGDAVRAAVFTTAAALFAVFDAYADSADAASAAGFAADEQDGLEQAADLNGSAAKNNANANATANTNANATANANGNANGDPSANADPNANAGRHADCTADQRSHLLPTPSGGAESLAAAGWLQDLAGSRAYQAGDFEQAIAPLMQAYDAARSTGQLRRAISLATNIGNAYASLNAHDSALEWMQRGLALARPTGWPLCLGQGLMQTAQALLQLGRRGEALIMLDQALETLAPLRAARAYTIALECRGDLALDGGDYERALACFTLLEERCEQLRQADFKSGAQRGQAHALSSLARPEEALLKAQAALDLAREQGDGYNQIAALTVLALIHTRHALPDPQPMFGPNAALHFLRQAMTVAATIEGYTVPADLLDAVASEYAGVGDYARAYEVALRAGAARDAFHSQDAARRGAAMQVRYQADLARAEAAHQRRLAAAESLRAAVVKQTSATLEHLVAIGQEITTHLEAHAVYRALDRHVHGLLDASLFAVYLIDADGGALTCVFGMDAGRSMDHDRLPLSDELSEPVRCVRERREILMLGEGGEGREAGNGDRRSRLYAPLLVGERVLGAVTVQSLAKSAYGERERLIFRSLCAYGAIALDNAAAYRQVASTLGKLSTAQAQLVEKNAELEIAYKALQDVSLTDQLTGLRNRRFFLQNIDSEVGMSLRRYDDPLRPGEQEQGGPGKDLVFFMVDIDHFKEVNDQHGHAAGDAVLVQMQERLREVFRETDYLIRWGGEEFLVLARATHRDDAKVVAERVRKAVAQRPFDLADGTQLHKTCSIGFACFPFLQAEPRLLSWTEVIELADQALYLVKRSGRNGWAAIYSTAETQYEDLFERMIDHLDQALAHGEARLVTSLEEPRLSAGAKTRRLVPAA